MSEQTEQPFDSWSGAAQMLAGPLVAEGLSSGLEQRCGKLIAARRASPTNDLTSVLVHAELDGERLEDHEIVARTPAAGGIDQPSDALRVLLRRF